MTNKNTAKRAATTLVLVNLRGLKKFKPSNDIKLTRATKVRECDILSSTPIVTERLAKAMRRMHEVVWSGELKFKFAAEYAAAELRLDRHEKATLIAMRDRTTEAMLLAAY